MLPRCQRRLAQRCRQKPSVSSVFASSVAPSTTGNSFRCGNLRRRSNRYATPPLFGPHANQAPSSETQSTSIGSGGFAISKARSPVARSHTVTVPLTCPVNIQPLAVTSIDRIGSTTCVSVPLNPTSFAAPSNAAAATPPPRGSLNDCSYRIDSSVVSSRLR